MKKLIFIILFFSFISNVFSSTQEYCNIIRAFIRDEYQKCYDISYNLSLTVGYSVVYTPSEVPRGGRIYIECWGSWLGIYENIFPDTFYQPPICTVTPPAQSIYNPNSCSVNGSIVEVENQVIGEVIPVIGAPFNLVYYSNRVIGRQADYIYKIPITSDFYSNTITSFNLLIKDELDASLVNTNYIPASNITYNYSWNGLDSSSVETWGKIKRSFTITETASDPLFPDTKVFYVGNLKAKKLGTGAWLPSIWHFYDANSATLFKGDGTYRNVGGVPSGAYTQVADQYGKEVYYFDSTGKISHTKTGLTGATIYTFAYDSSGRLSSITQPFGLVTNFNRDGSGVLQSITAPNGKVTVTTINTNGYLSKTSNPNSEEYNMTYYGTTGGLLNTFTKPTGDVTTLVYDSEGNLISDTHTNGFSLTLTKSNDEVTSVSAEGVSNVNRFDPFNNAAITTLSTGLSKYVYHSEIMSSSSSQIGDSQYDYEPDIRFGKQVKSILNSSINNYGSRYTNYSKTITLNDPADPFSINTFTEVQSVGSSQITSTYTGSTKTWLISSKLGRTIASELDTYERQISEKRGLLTSKTYTYTDDLLTKVAQSSARETNITYFPNKLVKDVTNSLGQVRSYTYDNAQRLLTETLPDLRVISYNYDSNGNMTSITPPSRPAHTFIFGLNDKLEDYIPPSLTGVMTVNTAYAYDLDKRLTKITRPDGKILDFLYNPTTGLLSTITGLFGTITKNYDVGRLSNIQDQYGSVINLAYTGNTVSYVSLITEEDVVYYYSRTPDAVAGEKTASETITGSHVNSVNRTIDYTYDDDELLVGAGSISMEYDTPNGMLVETTLTNVEDFFYYNDFGEIIQYVVKKGSPVIYQYDLVRDNLGRVTRKTELLNAVTTIWDYEYDIVGRLTQVRMNSVIVATYSYDSNSNRTGGVVRGDLTVATYDNQDRLLSYNGVSRSYNANGELTTLGTKTATYDIFGNLKQFVDGTTTIDYEIDPMQRRLGRILNAVPSSRVRYIFNPEGKIVGELNHENKLIKTFVYGSKAHVPDYYIDESGAEFRIITDHLGSVRMVVNASSGVVLQYIEHDEFGVVLQDTNPGLTPFGFAGGLYSPESGLMRFGARDYDPQAGRWLSKDPIRFGGGDTNLYGYTWNDPLNFVDPAGLFGFTIATGSAIGAAASPTSTRGKVIEISSGFGLGYFSGKTQYGGFVSNGSGNIISGALAGVGLNLGFYFGDISNLDGAGKSHSFVVGPLSYTSNSNLNGDWIGGSISVGGKGFGLSEYFTNTNTNLNCK